jgi:ABC-2 type transport system permease protein
MSGKRIEAIVQKEWSDMGKNKLVLLMMALLPVLMVGMIIGTAWLMERAPEEEVTNGDEFPLPAELAHLGPKTGMMILLNDQYMFYLLLIPLALPVYVAAYSIIGEKETRSLEPLLATPITTAELLIGKVIVAAAPATVLTWFSFALTAAGMYFIADPVVFSALVRPVWTLSIALHSPLFALLSTLCGVIASSRLNDPRAAQQVTALFVLPLIGISVAVLIGKVYINVEMIVWATVVMVLINAGVLWLAVRLFQRETILTRWR